MLTHDGQAVPFFEHLDRRTNYVFKEHFDEFRKTDDRWRRYTKIVPSSIFNKCVSRGDNTAYPNLVLRNRAELGVPAYRSLYPEWPTTFKGAFLAEFGIQVASLIDLVPELETKRNLGAQEKFLAELATELSAQIQVS